MEAFNLLKSNCWGSKPLVNFTNLPKGEYFVTEFSLVSAKHGSTIKVDLGDKYIFLPKRFAENQTPETIAELNSLPQIMIFNGLDANRKNM